MVSRVINNVGISALDYFSWTWRNVCWEAYTNFDIYRKSLNRNQTNICVHLFAIFPLHECKLSIALSPQLA